ncbi:putative F420-dependent oxidoreductase [Amycolatopsis bartoniae]|uniref:LLM class F420-dependent oxidoreductase n=1 Tax=Amycolatopsis bartoniae TaxID=941986 RepID=UPI0017906118|nr:LLM class F420-dependent oxidoreductase [Amycolatopsis bartoniae]MBB2939734.1 putative F420-dependent oxidoreductase [Amycolatopsis bartoniae]
MVSVRRAIGLTIPIAGGGLAGLPDVVATAAEAGITEVWSSESNGADAFTPLAVAATAGRRVRLGTGVAGYLTRGPALLAQSAAALAELAPGRTAIGIGSSSYPMVQGWNGIPFDRRVARARDTVTFLRQAFAGGTVRGPFETITTRGFRLARVPGEPPPVLVAALGPRMVELGLEHADGVVVNWLSPSDVDGLLGGRRDREVVCRIMVCPATDPQRLRDGLRPLFAGYLSVPTYAAFQRRLGRGELLEPMWRAWAAGDRAEAARCVPDEVIDDLVVHGEVAACRDRLRSYLDAGVTSAVLAIVGPDGGPAAPPWPELREMVAGLAAPARENVGSSR